MGVIMKGGTSGMRQDYLAQIGGNQASQPVLTTETSGAIPSTVHMDGGSTGNRDENSIASMPTGGSIPENSTDIEDPTSHR